MARYVYRCPACRTRRSTQALMRAHVQDTGHATCWCGGYHYKHRPGSPFCHQNPLSPVREVARQSDQDSDIIGVARGVIADHPNLADQVQELCARFGIQLPKSV